MQIQPNPAACLVAAFANVSGKKIEDLIEKIGHAGTQINENNKNCVNPYIGFHIQEIIEACHFDLAITEIMPAYADLIDIELPIGKWDNFQERVRSYLKQYNGVLVFLSYIDENHSPVYHSVAWFCATQSYFNSATNRWHTLSDKDDCRIFWIVEPKGE